MRLSIAPARPRRTRRQFYRAPPRLREARSGPRRVGHEGFLQHRWRAVANPPGVKLERRAHAEHQSRLQLWEQPAHHYFLPRCADADPDDVGPGLIEKMDEFHLFGRGQIARWRS